MQKYKILLIHNFYKFRGGEDVVFNSEKELLLKHGHKVVTYTRHNEQININGLVNKIKVFVNTTFSLTTYKAVKEIILKEKIDILHVHNTLPLISPSVYYAAFSLRVPVVQTIHNFRLLCPNGTFYRNNCICEECIKKDLSKALKYKCYRNSVIQTFTMVFMLKFHRLIGTYKKINAYITFTEFNKKKLSSLIEGCNKIHIKPNFVEATKVKLDLIKPNNYFVYIGRMDKAKGINFLVEAWKDIDISELFIIGEGPEADYINKYILKNNLRNIKLLGYMKKDKIAEIVKASIAVIIPSQCYEAFGMVAIEAFSLGIPVIAADIGALSTIVNENNGIKFEYNNKIDFINSIKLLQRDIDLRSKLCTGALQAHEKYYSEEINYKILKGIYEGIVETGNERCSILGIHINIINMNKAVNNILNNLEAIKGNYICVLNVHSTVMSYNNKYYRDIQNRSYMTLPDGKPLCILCKRKGFKNIDRVTGPDLMGEIFKISEELGYKHYFYGSTEATLEKLNINLGKRYPKLNIVGMFSPPFRALEKEEDEEIINSINSTKADFLWVGLGTPKQEVWIHEHKDLINSIMVGVGAGFDYYAGNIKRAPLWMQKSSLEWLYRLIQEPRRLWKRYLMTNTKFIFYLFKTRFGKG